MKKRTFKIFIQSQNNSSQEHLQMTIKQYNLRDRKRLRTIENQSEKIILQNNDIDDELTSNQKGYYLKNNAKKYSDHKVLVAHFQVHHDGNRKIENFIKSQENTLNKYPNTINHLNS